MTREDWKLTGMFALVMAAAMALALDFHRYAIALVWPYVTAVFDWMVA